MENYGIEALKEKVKFYTELIKVVSAFAIATTGGIAGLLFKLNYLISIPLLVLGVWIDTIWIFLIVWLVLEVRKAIGEIEKWI